MRSHPRIQLLFLILIIPLTAAAALAQGPWPEKAENLKVLPADTSAQQLRQVMQGFTRALGVRCEHCHVGEAGASLETFDFVADTNEHKNAARDMLRMVHAINTDHLAPRGNGAEVNCASCHRGQPEPPRPLAAVLQEEADKNGVDAAIETYQKLKQDYYGGIVYDFRAGSLNTLAQNLFQSGKQAEALKIAQLNLESNPDSVPALLLAANIQMRSGDTAGAKANLQKAAELDPGNRRVQGLLRRLERQP